MKRPNTEKAQIEFYGSQYRVKSSTSKVQFKMPKFQMPNHNKKPKYRKSPK
jgi:hypothetical protein